jgi:hypothetical protein
MVFRFRSTKRGGRPKSSPAHHPACTPVQEQLRTKSDCARQKMFRSLRGRRHGARRQIRLKPDPTRIRAEWQPEAVSKPIRGIRLQADYGRWNPAATVLKQHQCVSPYADYSSSVAFSRIWQPVTAFYRADSARVVAISARVPSSLLISAERSAPSRTTLISTTCSVTGTTTSTDFRLT